MSRDWTREELNAASEMMKQNGHMGFEEFCHALAQKQPVRFELSERRRKELVKDISEILGEKAEYMRMPTCAYRIGGYTVAKDGTLTWGADVTDAGILLQALTARGWNYAIVIDTAVTEETQPEYPSTDEEIPVPEVETAAPAEENADADTYDFCIELPEETLPDVARANLDRIIESKGNLLRKALGADTLIYEITDGKIRFPWFHISGSPEEVTAYTQLITALAEMAKNSKRITAKERMVENEKYAFRCFLIRLGFIGDAYKVARRVLMENLDGNSAFRNKK
ncbi:MAG: virulence protein [Firmicutes bacterium]|nr:virulence protein [Bacillota bacterium]MDY6159569.1 virulence protein [Candidatus Faecousia sp.]